MHSKKQKKSYPRRRKKVARKVEKKSPNKLKKRVPKSAEIVSKMTSILGLKTKMFFLRESWGAERSLEKETVDTSLRRFCAPQGLPNGEFPAAATFFWGYSFEEINLRVEKL